MVGSFYNLPIVASTDILHHRKVAQSCTIHYGESVAGAANGNLRSHQKMRRADDPSRTLSFIITI